MWASRVLLLVVAVVAVFLMPAPASGQRAIHILGLLALNTNKTPFSDMLLRRAVATSIDRIRVASERFKHAATGFAAPACLGHNTTPIHHQNLMAARGFLAQSGTSGEQIGPFALWVDGEFRKSAPGARQIQIILQNLQAVGFQVDTREFKDVTTLSLASAGVNVALLIVAHEFCEQSNPLEMLVVSGARGNTLKYSSPEIDAHIGRAKAAGDRQMRNRLFVEAEQKILTDAILVPIWTEPFETPRGFNCRVLDTGALDCVRI
ncbi:MAG TPA: ABC transporter substrate-binding protein [bacterium]|nr:ABC transporter substrate-binding protein [bacterium]